MIHTEPNIIEPTPEMRERLARFRKEHAGEELGGVGTRVIFEDDRVRIWELRLEPGEHSALHHHDHDYYLAIWSGDYVAGVRDGRWSSWYGDGALESEVTWVHGQKTGPAVFRNRDGTENTQLSGTYADGVRVD